MDRRTFTKLSSSVAATVILGNIDLLKKKTGLKLGDTIGLISPAGRISKDRLNTAIANLNKLRLKYSYQPAVLHQYGYLAGEDHYRIADIHQHYADPKIKAIWCIRGGYGTTRIIDHLDYKLIAKNPKPLIGYSDITALMQAIYQETGSPCYHGPVIGSELSDYAIEHLKPLFEPNQPFDIKVESEGFDIIYPGQANGRLCGGNLTLLASLCGTNYQLNSKNKVVFIEDIGEEPYRIDRVLTQLISSGSLDGAKAILFGIFKGCEPTDEYSFTLMEVLKDRTKRLKVPCAYGFPIGHIKDQCMLSIGRECFVDVEKRVFRLE